jgi:ABC-type multidrug transport system permease subunit
LVWADLKLFGRAKVAMFWTFAFPLLMLVMQMALFGHDTRLGPVSLLVQDRDSSAESAAYVRQLSKGLRLQHSISFQVLPANAAIEQADLVLVVPAGFGEHIAHGQTTTLELAGKLGGGPLYDAAYGMLRGMSDAYNLNGLSAPPRVSLPPPVARASGIAYGLYLATGLTGLIILSSGLMGFAGPLVAAREGGLFRLYQLFPMRTGTVVLAWWLSRLVVTVLASTVMLAVAHLLYGIQIGGGLAGMGLALVMLCLGTGAFLALGMLIAALSPNVAAVTMVCNLLYFPLMFAGNLMIPLGGLPEIVRQLLGWLPLNAMVDAMRGCLAEKADWYALSYSAVASTLTLLVCLAVSARRFTWVPRG